MHRFTSLYLVLWANIPKNTVALHLFGQDWQLLDFRTSHGVATGSVDISSSNISPHGLGPRCILTVVNYVANITIFLVKCKVYPHL